MFSLKYRGSPMKGVVAVCDAAERSRLKLNMVP